MSCECADIKLDSVLTGAMGKSGRAIIEALITGETNPAKLASLAHRRVKASQQELREALRGRVTKQHRFLLRLHRNQIDSLAAVRHLGICYETETHRMVQFFDASCRRTGRPSPRRTYDTRRL
jgi:hypothetical protein